MIPYGKQEITQQDIDAVVNVLKSDFLTQGPQVPLFENAIKEAVNAEYVLAVNSATSALHIACLALGVGKGDVVWTTPITFVASANCALYCGADVDFVDIDPETYNLSPRLLEQKLQHAQQNNLSLPKVVIPVHLCGQPCEMDKIHALSLEYGFAIIEDASHAIGGKYKHNPIGSCEYSDITVFSFHPVKIITTAEGGVATTNSVALAQKMDLLRSHGITRDEKLMTERSHGGWYYEQVDLGFNYRMTEMQAALGVSQMSRLHDFVAKRNELATGYDDLLKNLPLITPFQIDDSYSGRHLYVIRLKLDEISLSHQEVFEQLRENGIGVNLHYIPVHTQPYYKGLGFKQGQFPIAERYYTDAISIPLFHVMTNEQQDEVVKVLSTILVKA
ncbi:UDP-4-amino-4,6-dideoxy-N-acetyl-beta-L-altrosamine transaminase [Colwellia hornerae]|uniref:UDP-4-amino-4, 6-dideoxy-N-acetyl-beta-L-altrosamine transaminase n=1 Tax=Colwellia hornerae TaxID=89402 RepID=A0A5C6QJY2_9GAMM|nr:UDP-4-amino-4,6-dideoxy-N-acetyl-beta-L-altrosamine transaminase [Colwellia hornerae]TWX54036.1 UDP-4-amino-4,6-dideoxy-N-acetyl-beta-L-altrosamine transaminase [Colwellia hornerae]TWX60811.1 UDP-4-amino-4,6-dideoxy-N-acetyl-beta-L-altrosamine transaminase [Colwellia hornerae]TWX69141.1 UDP-4-amino-4,6-dideoxy-N-acetyl-beta-L-altrosamine transaminase [Colwellia hornerae]